jgi:hypothetical protein
MAQKGYERHNCRRARELTYTLIFSVSKISWRSIHDGGAAGQQMMIVGEILHTSGVISPLDIPLIFRRNLNFPQQKWSSPRGEIRRDNSFPGLFQDQTTRIWTVACIVMTPG